MTRIRFDVFGRELLVEAIGDGWATFFTGVEGKKRKADLVVPASVTEDQLEQYLADLCHEWASERHPSVRRLGE